MIMKLFSQLLFLLLLSAGYASAQVIESNEYSIKAAFVYNFLKFVKWPESVFTSKDQSLQLCILEPSPFERSSFVSKEGSLIQGRQLDVNFIESMSDASSCHALFVSSAWGDMLPRIVGDSKLSHTLTISDIENFSANGGMIEFVEVNNRIRFKIHLDSAKSADLQISSRLLFLAQEIYK